MASTDIASSGELAPQEEWRLRARHVSPLAFATFLCIGTLVVILGWLTVAGDPHGGEPRIVIPLTPANTLGDSKEVLLAQGTNGVLLPVPKPGYVDLRDMALNDSPWTTEDDLTALRDTNVSAGNGQALRPVPDPALIEQGPSGPLPVIASDGRRALEVYRRPFVDDGRPRIAIVLQGLGISKTTTRKAIRMLPPDVTFSFVPYTDNLQGLVNSARGEGHEVMLQLPMEPFDYPNNDPGPFTLLTNLSQTDNINRLEWLLSRVTGYVGVSSYLGKKFTSTPEAFTPILDALSARGLMYLAEGSAQKSHVANTADEIGLDWTESHRAIDYSSATSIQVDLLNLEAIARERGFAVGTGFAFPVAIEEIADWAMTLEQKGIALAPISAITLDPGS